MSILYLFFILIKISSHIKVYQVFYETLIIRNVCLQLNETNQALTR